ncbi:MAG TPA: polymer-forming cytoskeletal protein [Thermoanaerobaculia bacterium]|jgi:cytoskeletal protein CcmA (bactofilin family)
MALFSKDPAPATPAIRRDTPQPASGTTYIGANITIEGTISGSEPVVVEGLVRGNVNLTGDLRIGTKARIEATVHARNVIVEGQLTGDVSADDRVELVATASVDGNIKAPKIVMAEGAKFRGSVDMGSARPRDGVEVKAR